MFQSSKGVSRKFEGYGQIEECFVGDLMLFQGNFKDISMKILKGVPLVFQTLWF